ncbi:unnamed protein product [Durusdinium trenchii]|uniref:Uncharacterized protein n=1 Tax=Durusdinium trenchii TaxID=1381693 RepID=A0ABP0SHX0_9DINO
MSGSSPSPVPHTARGPREWPSTRAQGSVVQSPRLTTQQVIFWQVSGVSRPFPQSTPPPSGGETLRYLGTGYPPRQVLTSRKGAVNGELLSYVPEARWRPLPAKVFSVPKVISSSDPKRGSAILRSFSGSVVREADVRRREPENAKAGATASKEGPAASTASTPAASTETPPVLAKAPASAPVVQATPPAPALQTTPAMQGAPVPTVRASTPALHVQESATVQCQPQPATTLVESGIAPVAEPVEMVKSAKVPATIVASESAISPPPQPKARFQEESFPIRWPAGTSGISTPTLSRPSLAWTSPSAQVSPVPLAPSPTTQQRGARAEGSPSASRRSEPRLTGVKLESGSYSTGTPLTTPREMLGMGTYTPPHFEMFSSSSREMRPSSPTGRLGVTVRNISPQTRGVGGGLLISPSPLSFSNRRPPVPRRSGSPLSLTKADPGSKPLASPMTRQRTLPSLPPERSSTTVLTARGLEAQAQASTPELMTEKPPARAVGEARSSVENLQRRRWRRPSNPSSQTLDTKVLPSRPPGVPGTAHHDGNQLTPAAFRLQEKLSYLAEEGTISL